MEDGARRSAILHIASSILVLFLIGCQSTPPPKVESFPPPGFNSYLYSLYDTEWASLPRESIKEDRLELKPNATLVVARLGEFAPREELLEQLRTDTDWFARVQGIPAVLDISQPPTQKVSQGMIKDHVIKMRHLASDIGGDYLYLLGGTMSLRVEQEFTGVLDLTIIGYFVVPSQRMEAETRGSAAVLEVESGRVLSVVTEQDKVVSHAPTSSLEDRKKRFLDEVNAQMESELTTKVIEQIRERLAPR